MLTPITSLSTVYPSLLLPIHIAVQRRDHRDISAQISTMTVKFTVKKATFCVRSRTNV